MMRRPIEAAAARNAPSERMATGERRLQVRRVDRYAVLREPGDDGGEPRRRSRAGLLVRAHDPVGEQRAAPLAEALPALAVVFGESDARRELERERRNLGP